MNFTDRHFESGYFILATKKRNGTTSDFFISPPNFSVGSGGISLPGTFNRINPFLMLIAMETVQLY